MSQGLLMLDLKGEQITEDEKTLIENEKTGGIIFFSRNFSSASQLSQMVSDIRSIRPEILLAVDHEGGRVQRFKGNGFTTLPAMKQVGALYKTNPQLALELARDCGEIAGLELAAFDIDINFAPVLDIDRHINLMLDGRSFGENPTHISHLASAYIKGIQKSGIHAVGKHFPGHGGVKSDTHTSLVRDPRSFDEIREDLLPFQNTINDGVDGIMLSHIVYSQCCDQPAVFSSFWVQEILRKKMGFNGVVFSDCLNMTAASSGGDFSKRAQKALNAGCDMILVCNNREGAKETLHMMKKAPVNPQVTKRLQGLKKRPHESDTTQKNRIKQKLKHFFTDLDV